jgi:hypothetical protein
MARPYAIYAGLSFSIITATSIEDARWHMLINMNLDRKPWLAKDWKIHPATPEENRRWIAQLVEEHRPSTPSEPTAQDSLF